MNASRGDERGGGARIRWCLFYTVALLACRSTGSGGVRPPDDDARVVHQGTAPVDGDTATSVAPLLVYDSGRPTGVVRTPTKADGALMLRRLYKSFHATKASCGGTATTLAAMRASGEIVPSVLSVARGAFTKAGSVQELWDVFVGECWAAHSDNWGSHELVVLEGGAIVLREVVAGGLALRDVVDLDGDGRSELLIDHAFSQAGATEAYGSVATVGVGGWTVLKELGVTYQDTCLAGLGNPPRVVQTHHRVRRELGGKLLYEAYEHVGTCTK